MGEKWLFVRYQTGNILLVNGCNHSARTQVTFALRALGGQNMTGKGCATLDTPGRRFSEALGSAAICFNLRHEKLLLRYKNLTCAGNSSLFFWFWCHNHVHVSPL